MLIEDKMSVLMMQPWIWIYDFRFTRYD
jgi:hypothetical protein